MKWRITTRREAEFKRGPARDYFDLARSIKKGNSNKTYMKNNQPLYTKSSEYSRGDQQPRLPNSHGDLEISQGKAWHIPNHPSRKYGVSNAKSNKYLNHQWNRLTDMVRKGEIEKAFLAFSHLARRSISLRTFFLNRVAKGWYHSMGRDEVTKLMKEVSRLLGSSRSDVKLYRFYLPKPDGRKRPIGAPSLAWRIIIAMWTDFLYIVINPRISDNHHGFRPKRGLMTAWQEIWSKYEKLENPVVFEIDLEGFFNNINMGKALEILKEYGAPIWWIRWFDWANACYPLIHKDKIEQEKELSVDKITTDQVFGTTRYSQVSRKGAPQGAGWSPLLAVMVLNNAMKLLGIDITWYADDALGICATMEDWNKLWLHKDKLAEYGIILSEKTKKDGKPATRIVDDGEVTFLGLTWDPREDMLKINDTWKERRKVSEKEIQVAAWNAYEGQGRPWHWETKPDSYLFDMIREEQKKQFERTGIWLDPYCKIGEEGLDDPHYVELLQENLWGRQSHTWLSSVNCWRLSEKWKSMKTGDKAHNKMDNIYSSDLYQRSETRMIPMTTGLDLSRRNKPIRKIGKVLFKKQQAEEEVLRKVDDRVTPILKRMRKHYKAYEKLHGYKYLATIVEKRKVTYNSYLPTQSVLIPVLGTKIPGHSPAFYGKELWGMCTTPGINYNEAEKARNEHLTSRQRINEIKSRIEKASKGLAGREGNDIERIKSIKSRIAAASQRLAGNLERGKHLIARLEELKSNRK